ncbi:MAG TPA: CBS domain-containing protein [Baekduia sp.]
MRPLSDVDGLTAADVMHRQLTSLPASTTVGELRAYFASSASRRLAVVVDGERFVGSIVAAAIPDGVAGHAAAADFVAQDPTVHPSAPAQAARDLAIEQDSLRLPVVDDAGTLVGIVAITKDRRGFCGT